MKTNLKVLALGGFISTLLSTPLNVSAISLERAFGLQVLPHPSSPMYMVTSSDGIKYDVPYVLTTTATNKRYNFYATKGRNAFFRKTYGYAVTFQPTPSGAIRLAGVNSYKWSDLYEATYRPYSHSHKNFEKGYSVRVNTINCGYVGSKIGCLSGTNGSNLNPDGQTGHTSSISSFRLDGSFGESGDWGESRFIGYSDKGNHIDNSYYVMDNPQKYTAANYPYDKNIFEVSKKNINPTDYDKAGFQRKKLKAIERLLKQEGMPGKASDWLNKLSLQTNPDTEAPVFLATRNDGAGYQVFVVHPESQVTMNLGVISLKVYDTNGKLLAGITRDKVGSDKLTIDFAGKDLNSRPKLEPGETYKVEVVVQNGSEAKTKSTTQKITFNGKDYTACGSLAAGAKCTFKIDYTAPEKGDQKVTLEAFLPESYNSTGDNLDPIDDYLSTEIMVNQAPRGNIALTDVYLVEAKTNKVVSSPIQGVDYYLQFKGTYDGESMKGNEFSFKVQADVTTSVPQTDGTLAESFKTYFTNEVKTKLPATSDGKPLVFDFKTPTFKATSSEIKVDATLIGPNNFKWNFNTNKGDDSVHGEWKAPINLTLSQVTLDPSGHPGGDYCGTLNLSYWVDFKLAYDLTNRPLEAQEVEVAFYVNGTYLKSDKIKVYATQSKRQYTTQLNLSNHCVEAGAKIEVKVNPTHKLAEYDMSDNNKTVSWNSKYPAEYCENKNTSLSWKQEYLDLALITNGYGQNVDQVDSTKWISVQDYEKVTITKIEMRSKLMTDKKMGPNQDGWVDALNPGRDKIQIKAGYGFDLRVTVEYETDAYVNETTDSRLAAIPISRLHTPLKPLNIMDNLFIKLPGTTNQTISLYSSDLKLERDEPTITTNATTKYTWTYTIANRLSPNGTNQLVNDLFVDENTKDGEYELKFYTAPIYGVPGKTLLKDANQQGIEYDPICASQSIKFEVKGSVYDDLNVGLIQ